jgi:hypothetical protein
LIAQEDFKQSWPGFDLAGAPQRVRRILDRATVRLKVLRRLDRDDARQSDAPVTDLDLRCADADGPGPPVERLIGAVRRQPEAERQQYGVSSEQRDDLSSRQAQVQRGGKSTQHHGWSDLAADEIAHNDRTGSADLRRGR